MINDLGYTFLVAAFAVSLYGALAPHLGVRADNWNLVRSVQVGALVNLVLVLLASLVLLRAFLADDFSVVFVWQNSSTDLPLGYKLSAFWGGMDGSLLFWELILAAFTAAVAFGYQRTNREILPYVLTTLSLVHVFLLFLLVTWANPLATQMPVPPEGRGLNPLLQHPAMALHPPLLYLGYVGFSVPFAFAIGSLVRGKLDNQWVISTRRWTLFAWYALAVGQMMGGQWAYEELGWGGFWGWDPVENAAFMPWLTGTAFLHSIMLQEKRNMMKVWNMVLIIITFGLSILGTFIVRSGVLNSVHSFAQSEIGPAFLIFLGVILVASFFLLFRRMRLLESPHTSDRLLSKETTFLLNNLLFVGIAFTVFLGTVFPLVAEAVRGTKLSIQAPFFNTITAPLGIALLGLTGVCTLIAWRHSSTDFLVRNFRWPVLLGVVAGVATGVLVGPGAGPIAVFTVAVFTAAVLVQDFQRAVRVRAHQQGIGIFPAIGSTVMRNQQRYGGMLIHLGVVAMFIGFAGSYFGTEYNISLQPGQTKQVGEYTLTFEGMETSQPYNATLRAAVVSVSEDGEPVGTMRPARSFYPTQPDPLTEVAIDRNIARDLYLVLASENDDGSVSLRVLVNPLIVWAWFAFPLFTLGAGIAIFYKPRRLPAPVTERGLGYASR